MNASSNSKMSGWQILGVVIAVFAVAFVRWGIKAIEDRTANKPYTPPAQSPNYGSVPRTPHTQPTQQSQPTQPVQQNVVVGHKICSACNGSGVCTMCGGKGGSFRPSPSLQEDSEGRCIQCQGRGSCASCNGRGEIPTGQ